MTATGGSPGVAGKGRTPAQALMEALGVDAIPEIAPTEELIEPLPSAA